MITPILYVEGGGLMFYLITMPIIRPAQKLHGHSTLKNA
jgi:hypothetical protein